MACLLDTNILSRILQVQHPSNTVAIAAVAQLGQSSDQIVIVPQVMVELWVVCTRPLINNGLELSVEDAHSRIEE